MRFAYPAVLLCAAACASAPAVSRSAITSADMQASAITPTASSTPLRGHMLTGSFTTEYYAGETLHDVLRRRLPLYLRPRTASGADIPGRGDPVAVYINGSFSGSLDVLSLIPASEVFSVQRMSGSEALIRFGPKHNSGALLVTLIRR